MASENRRRHRRARVAACAALETSGVLNGCDQALCTVQNVSRCGICVETGQPPLCGQPVRLRIGVGDEIHELRALTIRVDRVAKSNFYQVGLDWSGCTAEQLAFLDRYLAEVARAQRS